MATNRRQKQQGTIYDLEWEALNNSGQLRKVLSDLRVEVDKLTGERNEAITRIKTLRDENDRLTALVTQWKEDYDALLARRNAAQTQQTPQEKFKEFAAGLPALPTSLMATAQAPQEPEKPKDDSEQRFSLLELD